MAEPCNHLFSVFPHLCQKLTPHLALNPAWRNPMGSMKCNLVLFVFEHLACSGAWDSCVCRSAFQQEGFEACYLS